MVDARDGGILKCMNVPVASPLEKRLCQPGPRIFMMYDPESGKRETKLRGWSDSGALS